MNRLFWVTITPDASVVVVIALVSPQVDNPISPSDLSKLLIDIDEVSYWERPLGVAIHMSPSNSITSSTYEIGSPSSDVHAVSQLSPVAFHLATPLSVAM